MVAIKDYPFLRKSGDETPSFEHLMYHDGPVTPTASDCLSSCGDVSDDSGTIAASVVALAPIRRDPTLLMERLENCVSRRRVGRGKRRQAHNEAALAALVEGYEEDPKKLYIRPYHSAFAKLHECPIRMMVWHHFISLSDEEQKLYLTGAGKRTRLQRINKTAQKNASSHTDIRSEKSTNCSDLGVVTNANRIRCVTGISSRTTSIRIDEDASTQTPFCPNVDETDVRMEHPANLPFPLLSQQRRTRRAYVSYDVSVQVNDQEIEDFSLGRYEHHKYERICEASLGQLVPTGIISSSCCCKLPSVAKSAGTSCDATTQSGKTCIKTSCDNSTSTTGADYPKNIGQHQCQCNSDETSDDDAVSDVVDAQGSAIPWYHRVSESYAKSYEESARAVPGNPSIVEPHGSSNAAEANSAAILPLHHHIAERRERDETLRRSTSDIFSNVEELINIPRASPRLADPQLQEGCNNRHFGVMEPSLDGASEVVYSGTWSSIEHGIRDALQDERRLDAPVEVSSSDGRSSGGDNCLTNTVEKKSENGESSFVEKEKLMVCGASMALVQANLKCPQVDVTTEAASEEALDPYGLDGFLDASQSSCSSAFSVLDDLNPDRCS